MFYANRTLKIQKADGEYEFRKAGDAVPEAASWKQHILTASLSAGHLIEDDKEPKIVLRAAGSDEFVPKSDTIKEDKPVEVKATRKPRKKKSK